MGVGLHALGALVSGISVGIQNVVSSGPGTHEQQIKNAKFDEEQQKRSQIAELEQKRQSADELRLQKEKQEHGEKAAEEAKKLEQRKALKNQEEVRKVEKLIVDKEWSVGKAVSVWSESKGTRYHDGKIDQVDKARGVHVIYALDSFIKGNKWVGWNEIEQCIEPRDVTIDKEEPTNPAPNVAEGAVLDNDTDAPPKVGILETDSSTANTALGKVTSGAKNVVTTAGAAVGSIINKLPKIHFTWTRQYSTVYCTETKKAAGESVASSGQTDHKTTTDAVETSAPDEELEFEEECVICMSEKKTNLFVPCGHRCVCENCAQIIIDGTDAKCPICRAVPSTHVKMFDC